MRGEESGGGESLPLEQPQSHRCPCRNNKVHPLPCLQTLEMRTAVINMFWHDKLYIIRRAERGREVTTSNNKNVPNTECDEIIQAISVWCSTRFFKTREHSLRKHVRCEAPETYACIYYSDARVRWRK